MRLIREGARIDSDADAGLVDQNRAVYRDMMIPSARLHTIPTEGCRMAAGWGRWSIRRLGVVLSSRSDSGSDRELVLRRGLQK